MVWLSWVVFMATLGFGMAIAYVAGRDDERRGR